MNYEDALESVDNVGKKVLECKTSGSQILAVLLYIHQELAFLRADVSQLKR